jgi:hypothetical protein
MEFRNKDPLIDLINRHDHVYSKTEIRFSNWRASLDPLHFQQLVDLLTNNLLFGPISPNHFLVIVGRKFTGKTTLSKQIWEYLPGLHIIESYEPIPDQPYIYLRHPFFSEEEYEKYFSMPVQPYYLGNIDANHTVFNDISLETK